MVLQDPLALRLLLPFPEEVVDLKMLLDSLHQNLYQVHILLALAGLLNQLEQTAA